MDHTDQQFKIDVSQHSGTHVVSIHGSLADNATGQAKEAFLQVLAAKPARILIDLEGMDYISSSGIGILVSLLRRCRQRNVNLPVCGLKPEVMELFKLTRLSQVFEIFEGREAALRGR